MIKEISLNCSPQIKVGIIIGTITLVVGALLLNAAIVNHDGHWLFSAVKFLGDFNKDIPICCILLGSINIIIPLALIFSNNAMVKKQVALDKEDHIQAEEIHEASKYVSSVLLKVDYCLDELISLYSEKRKYFMQMIAEYQENHSLTFHSGRKTIEVSRKIWEKEEVQVAAFHCIQVGYIILNKILNTTREIALRYHTNTEEIIMTDRKYLQYLASVSWPYQTMRHSSYFIDQHKRLEYLNPRFQSPHYSLQFFTPGTYFYRARRLFNASCDLLRSTITYDKLKAAHETGVFPWFQYDESLFAFQPTEYST